MELSNHKRKFQGQYTETLVNITTLKVLSFAMEIRVEIPIIKCNALDSKDREAMSHPVLEGKPNANHVRARIRTHVHSDYINDSS
jgi:hypothetical protein